jgi:hypothetical protein
MGKRFRGSFRRPQQRDDHRVPIVISLSLKEDDVDPTTCMVTKLFLSFLRKQESKYLLEIAPENPVLWAGMKGVSAKGRKNLTRC